MLKNTQFKIVLIFFLVGIVIISGIGVFFFNSLNMINTQIGQDISINQLQQIINNLEINTRTVLVVSGIVFALVSLIIAIFLSKFVIYPINK